MAMMFLIVGAVLRTKTNLFGTISRDVEREKMAAVSEYRPETMKFNAGKPSYIIVSIGSQWQMTLNTPDRSISPELVSPVAEQAIRTAGSVKMFAYDGIKDQYITCTVSNACYRRDCEYANQWIRDLAMQLWP
jgi:hypothetical protein